MGLRCREVRDTHWYLTDMIRDDLSNKLIHLVRGETAAIAFGKFSSILEEGKLRGGTGYIRGSYRCVCFTETPLAKLGYVLADPDLSHFCYRPFGVMVDKKSVFEQGGRPVIYQPESEYDKLHEDHKYRHVRFEPTNQAYSIDHTWEREWRLKADEFVLPSESTTVIVPNRTWRDNLVMQHASRIEMYVEHYGRDARTVIEPYPWQLAVLEDLGISIPDTLC